MEQKHQKRAFSTRNKTKEKESNPYERNRIGKSYEKKNLRIKKIMMKMLENLLIYYLDMKILFFFIS